jgi:hypothetical protein
MVITTDGTETRRRTSGEVDLTQGQTVLRIKNVPPEQDFSAQALRHQLFHHLRPVKRCEFAVGIQ